MSEERPADEPLRPDDRFGVELARFVDGRPDPSVNTHPAGSGPVDVLAILEGQEQLDRIVG